MYIIICIYVLDKLQPNVSTSHLSTRVSAFLHQLKPVLRMLEEFLETNMQNRTSIASACSVGCARTQRIGVTRLGSKRCTFSDLGNLKVRTLHQLMCKRNHGNRDIPSTKLVLAICNHSLVTRPVSSSVASYLLPLLGEV